MVWCIRAVASTAQAFVRPKRQWCLHTRFAPWIFKNLNLFALEHRAAEFVVFFIPMLLADVAGTVILARIYPKDDYLVAALFALWTTIFIWLMKGFYLFLKTGAVAADPSIVRHDERDCYADRLADVTPGFLGRPRHNFTFTGPLSRVSYLYLNPFGNECPRVAEAGVYLFFATVVFIPWLIYLWVHSDASTPSHEVCWPLIVWAILVWLITLYFFELPAHVWTPEGQSREDALEPDWLREDWDDSSCYDLHESDVPETPEEGTDCEVTK